jgi:hypothetical protein
MASRRFAMMMMFRSTPPQRGDLFSVWCRSHARVSIHAPAKGRPRHHFSFPQDAQFRSTPPQRGDSLTLLAGCQWRCFDPRPRKGATPRTQRSPALLKSFDPRPRKGATCCHPARSGRPASFDPRPRKGATGDQLPLQLQHTVSIHAPAKGRHEVISQRISPQGVSIHAPAKGRHCSAVMMCQPIPFRSTPPQRGDASRWLYRKRHQGFDPRPRKGATSNDPSKIFEILFRSTPPQRGDSAALSNVLSGWTFRSTPPQRGDPDRWQPRRADQVSIHAPAKGRLGASSTREISWKFRSTPPQRGDRLSCNLLLRHRKRSSMREAIAKLCCSSGSLLPIINILHDFKELSPVRTARYFSARLPFAHVDPDSGQWIRQ